MRRRASLGRDGVRGASIALVLTVAVGACTSTEPNAAPTDSPATAVPSGVAAGSTTTTPASTASASTGACVSDPLTYTAHATAGAVSGPLPAGTADALDRAVGQAIASTQQPGSPVSTQAPGTIAAVSSPAGIWVKAYGVANTTTGAAMTTALHHRIGSVTKTFTATLILQLASEGKVSLTDHVSSYVLDVPRGDQITIDNLITMRSGIADYFDAFLPTWIANSNVVYTPDQMLKIGYAHPPLFAPGAGFDYSNSNYLLLGKVIEKVTGDSLGDAMIPRILAPLRLTGTSWPGGSAALPDPYDHGYTTVVSVNGAIAGTPDGSLVDASAYNPAWSGAAGEMTSTAQDLLAYGRALGTGAGLLPARAQLARLSSFSPAFSSVSQYGQGLICRSGWGRPRRGHAGLPHRRLLQRSHRHDHGGDDQPVPQLPTPEHRQRPRDDPRPTHRSTGIANIGAPMSRGGQAGMGPTAVSRPSGQGDRKRRRSSCGRVWPRAGLRIVQNRDACRDAHSARARARDPAWSRLRRDAIGRWVEPRFRGMARGSHCSPE